MRDTLVCFSMPAQELMDFGADNRDNKSDE